MTRIPQAIPWGALGQVGGLYLAGGWAVLEAVDVLANNLDLPGWVFRVVLIVFVVGLPSVLVITLLLHRARAPSGHPLRTAGTAVLGMALVGALLISIPGVRQTGRQVLMGSALPGVGVLPFGWVGPDSSPDSYLAEAVSISLAEAVQRTGVFSPSWPAVKRFRGDLPPMADIGRELNVGYILLGDLVARGGALELSVWLTRAKDDVAVWQRTFDGLSRDLVDFELEIVRAVIDSLSTLIGVEPAAIPVVRYTEDPVADSLYRRAQYLYTEFYDTDSTAVAKALFERAIERDSSFAPAYVGAAITTSHMSRVAWKIPPREAAPEIRLLLECAEELAPDLSSVKFALGWYYYAYEYDWTASRLLMEAALEDNPNIVGGEHWSLPFPMAAIGKTDSAVALARRATELEPHNPMAVLTESWILYLAHRYAESEARAQFVLDSLQADHPAAPGFKRVSEFTRRFLAGSAPKFVRDSAARVHLAVHERGRLAPERQNSEMSPAMRLAMLGWHDAARRALRDDMQFDAIRPLRVANVYAWLGEMDTAWTWLERAYEMRDPYLAESQVRPEMAPFRADPRWPEFRRRMGFD